MNMNSMENQMIQKKAMCKHCTTVIDITPSSTPVKCSCGKITMIADTITEGVQGTDWVDTTPNLLNG